MILNLSTPIPIARRGPPVNSEYSEGDTYLAADESWEEADAGHVYWVDVAVIEQMRR